VEGVLAALAVGGVLTVLWVLANRRQVATRAGRDAEWSAGESRPQLWTSQLPCPSCGARGGSMREQGRRLVFTCLACQRQHEREHRL
jgi:hypothetical protein